MLLIPANAFAQVVNSGPGGTQAQSQVTLSATVPNIVLIKIDPARSVLSHAVNPSLIDSTANLPTTNFQIQGDVIVNNANAVVQCSVSTLTLEMVNGTDKMKTLLNGTIGGRAITTTAFSPSFNNRKASILIDGDLDESTVTSQIAPGNYTGTFIITASLF